MSKHVTLHLDEFGQQALERFARPGTASDAAAVRTACLYYIADRKSGRAAWRVPRFAANSSSAKSLKVGVDDATWTALAEEAKEQGVTPEILAVHAMLYFLADLDSGRIAELLEGALEDTE
jgi:hypothetical protein